MKAAILDALLDEFAPQVEPPAGRDFTLGRPGLDVSRFFVAWNPGQLEGIVRKDKGGEGAYVAYLGILDDRVRCLVSLALKGLEGFVIRFVSSVWRYHSWGVADRIARDIGIADPQPVFVIGREPNFKVVTFVPQKDVPKVRDSLFAAGAGRYGLYSKCSFSIHGKGTFLGEKGAKPAYGQAGHLEEIEEERLEVLVPADRVGKAVSALKRVHPYEEPVIETYELGASHAFGEGRMGQASSPLTSSEASRRIVSVLGSQPTYLSGNSECNSVIVWDGEPGRGLYEALLRDMDLCVGPDSRGLAKLLASGWRTEVVEFPRYCFVMAGAKELVHIVREKSKRESWGLRTFLPSKVGREGVHI